MTTTIQETINFANENGLHIFPLEPKGKRPMIVGYDSNGKPLRLKWEPYKERQATEKEIEAWFENGKNNNLAFVCGAGRNNKYLTVLDIDDKDVYRALYPNGTDTRAQETANGFHILFTTPEPIPVSHTIKIQKDDKEVGVDVQGQWSYIVAPGSVHPDGPQYKWVNNLPIVHLEGETADHFQTTLLKKLDKVCKVQGWRLKSKKEMCDIDEIAKGVKAGNRNDSAYRYAAWHKQNGRSQIETEDLLEEWNLKNSPPLPQSELMEIVRSAFKPGAKVGYDFGLEDTGESEFFTKEGRPKVKEISQSIFLRHRFITLNDNEEILIYNSHTGVYDKGGGNIIKTEIKQNFGRVINDYWGREIKSYIQSSTYINRKEINKEKNIIHLKNGIYDMEQGALVNFTPDIISTVSLPIEYDPDGKCPEFERFLTEVANPNDIPSIKEMFGYCLHKGYEIHNMFVFVGQGSNGKSVLLNVLRAMLGEHNVISIPLQRLGEDRFALCKLEGKLANIDNELPSKALYQTGTFKKVTGGDVVHSDMKYSKDGVEFENFAKLIYACNQPPMVYDDTYANWRRFIMFKFNTKFVAGEGQDPNKLKKLTTSEEISGIFNMAVGGLKTLFERGYFEKSANIEETRKDYIRMSDSIKAFCEDCVVEDYDEHITKDDFYLEYRAYVKRENLKLESKSLVGKRMGEIMGIRAGRPMVLGEREPPSWLGIKIIGANKKKSEDNKNHIEGWGGAK